MSEPLVAFPHLLRLAQCSRHERTVALQQLNDLDLSELFQDFGGEVSGRLIQSYAQAYPEHPDDDLEPVREYRPAPSQAAPPSAPAPSRSWADASQESAPEPVAKASAPEPVPKETASTPTPRTKAMPKVLREAAPQPGPGPLPVPKRSGFLPADEPDPAPKPASFPPAQESAPVAAPKPASFPPAEPAPKPASFPPVPESADRAPGDTEEEEEDEDDYDDTEPEEDPPRPDAVLDYIPGYNWLPDGPWTNAEGWRVRVELPANPCVLHRPAHWPWPSMFCLLESELPPWVVTQDPPFALRHLPIRGYCSEACPTRSPHCTGLCVRPIMHGEHDGHSSHSCLACTRRRYR